ncbi:MAG: ABC-type lipoprotein release transport system permease subunit [Candidatus Azotimanducaceae bacterium]|jgi:ABC-type lipoprotein release transport system permease subunit
MLIYKLAIRNLFRNTRRTILTVMLIGFSLAALILTNAITGGMIKVMVESVTHTISGEAQIHRLGFRDNLDIDLYLEDSSDIENRLAQDNRVKSYSPRVIAGGMISSSYNVTGGAVYGVDAAKEASVSKLKLAVVQGNYLSEHSTENATEILIGKPMAELLEIGLGDRIVITLAEANTGELTQALFRVSGIFFFGTREIDENMVFINIEKAREVINIYDASHEIALLFHESDITATTTQALLREFNHGETEALDWQDLFPEISSVLVISDFSSFIVGFILFLLASLGVINSMFMSIYERIYEFGVAKAIGTKPIQLLQLVLFEGFLIALMSCAFGIAIGGGIGFYYETRGIPMGEFEFAGIAMNNKIPTVLTLEQFTQFPVYVILLTLVATLYPARFAANIVPSQALQKSL